MSWSFPGAMAPRSLTTTPRRWRGWLTRWSMTSSGTPRTGSFTSQELLIRQFHPCAMLTLTHNGSFQVFDKWGYAGGATDDWYSSTGISYSYTWELPEADRQGQDLISWLTFNHLSVMGSTGSNYRQRISKGSESISLSGSWEWLNTLRKRRNCNWIKMSSNSIAVHFCTNLPRKCLSFN